MVAATSIQDVNACDDPSPSTRVEAGYIAESSVLRSHENPLRSPIHEAIQSGSSSCASTILAATESNVLPKQPLRQALTDLCVQNIAHRYSLLDSDDIDNPHSILLQQAICLAGSMMRHVNDVKTLTFSHSLYEKCKTLIHFNAEKNDMAVLKAMCLMTVWSPNPSNSTSLDGPWPWTGAAMRLAIQLGLHRQSTYAGKPGEGSRRRIWWFLFVSASWSRNL